MKKVLAVLFTICMCVGLLSGCELGNRLFLSLFGTADGTPVELPAGNTVDMGEIKLHVVLHEDGTAELYDVTFELTWQSAWDFNIYRKIDAEACFLEVCHGTYTQEEDILTIQFGGKYQRILVQGTETEKFQEAYLKEFADLDRYMDISAIFDELGTLPKEYLVHSGTLTVNTADGQWKIEDYQTRYEDGAICEGIAWQENGNLLYTSYEPTGMRSSQREYSPGGTIVKWTQYDLETGETGFIIEYYEDGNIKSKWQDGEYTYYAPDGTRYRP